MQDKSRKTAPRDVKRKEDRYWSQHRVEDVYFQRETQVNFWSIMGGVAAAALLTQFFPLVAQVQAGRWHLVLYYMASIFILINSWVQAAWGALVLRWRISFALVMPFFFILFCASIMSLLVTNPAGWSLAVAGVLLFNLLLQNAFRTTGAREDFPANRKKAFAQENIFYFILLLTSVGMATLMFFHPSGIIEAVWGGISLVLSAGAIWMQHVNMMEERRDLEIP